MKLRPQIVICPLLMYHLKKDKECKIYFFSDNKLEQKYYPMSCVKDTNYDNMLSKCKLRTHNPSY